MKRSRTGRPFHFEFVFMLFVFLLMTTFATTPSAADGAEQQTGQNPRPFLWALSRNGHTSHAFATLPFQTTWEDVPDDAKKIFETSELLLSEGFFTDVVEQKVHLERLLRTHPLGRRWRITDHLAPQNREIFRLALTKNSPQYDRIHPATAIPLLDLLGRRILYKEAVLTRDQEIPKTSHVVDFEFQKLARKQQIPVRLLESKGATQELMLDEFTAGDVDDLLTALRTRDRHLILSPDLLQSHPHAIRAYRRGDWDYFERWRQAIEVAPGPMARMYRRFFNRHEEWLRHVQATLVRKRGFLVANVAHFVGDNSILRILQTNGFHVTPVAWRHIDCEGGLKRAP